MVQRIQTVYVLISAILLGLLFSLPFADILFGNQDYLFDIRGIVLNDKVQISGLPIALFIAMTLLIHVIVLFIYKKRILQMRMLVFSIILMLGLFGIFYFFTYYSFDNAEIHFKLCISFPLVAIILDYLAIRAIGKDEALIRSVDRIR